MSGWRPIKTAPKDEVRVILGCSKLVGSGHFWDNKNEKHPKARWVWDGWPCYEPTHWKPLPEPPK